MTFAPQYPLLSAALWAVSVAVYARGTCHLAVFAVARGGRSLGRVLGWQAAASGLTSATAFSAGWWEAGVFFGVLAAWCAVLWRRERSAGLNAESAESDAE